MVLQVKKDLLRNIVTFVNKFKLLEIIKKSKKFQKLLGINIVDYKMASLVSQYYSLQGNPCSLEQDNERFQVSGIRYYISKLQMKNMAFSYQLAYFNINIEKRRTEILFDNNKYPFTCSLIVPEYYLLLCGTRKGKIVTFSIVDNTIKEEIEVHHSKVTKIIKLKYDSYTNNFASCSEINEVNIYSLEDGHLNLIKTFNCQTKPIHSIVELHNTLVVCAKVMKIINIKDETIKLLDSPYCSKYCLLPFDNGNKIVIGSSKLFIMDLKPKNRYEELLELNSIEITKNNTWHTESTFAIRDILYYPNKCFVIAEDNHIKLCSLIRNKKNIIIDLGKILPIHRLKPVTDSLILTASEDGTIILVDIDKYKVKSVYLSPHQQGVINLELGLLNEIYSIGADGKIIKIEAAKEYVNNYVKYFEDKKVDCYYELDDNVKNVYYDEVDY